MAIYNSTSKIATNLKGVHLYHYAMSNCSQRCRLALELKNILWHSHHKDLGKKEHLNPEYLEINPNGVVPTLVHDGVVILESNDIISYIESNFEGPSFASEEECDKSAVSSLLESSSDVQGSIKALSHEYLFTGRRNTTLAEIEAMEAEGASAALVSFLRDYVVNGDNWATRLSEAHTDIKTRLEKLEDRLAGARDWLSGDRFGLADLSWIVNYYRLQQCRQDLALYPRFLAWGETAVALPAFQKAVVNYRP